MLVLDENGTRLGGAAVHVTWTLPDGSTLNQVVPSRNNGWATVRIRDGSGDYTLTVKDIVRTGYTFDPANSVLERTVTAP